MVVGEAGDGAQQLETGIPMCDKSVKGAAVLTAECTEGAQHAGHQLSTCRGVLNPRLKCIARGAVEEADCSLPEHLQLLGVMIPRDKRVNQKMTAQMKSGAVHALARGHR